MSKAKVVFIDLETSALVTRAWQMKYPDRPIDLVEDWKLLCIGYKTRGEKEVVAKGVDTMSEEKLVRTLWRVIDEADVVVGHNIKNFDLKKAYAKFAEFGMEPPRPPQVVDTKEQASKHFGFSSNQIGRAHV